MEFFADETDGQGYAQRQELWKAILKAERRFAKGLNRKLGSETLWPFGGGAAKESFDAAYVANARTLGVLMGFLNLHQRYEFLW